MKTNRSKQIITSVVMLIALILITVGGTYAFFTYMKQGSTENTISTGSLTFIYDEKEAQGNGINMTNVFPVSDENGKALTGANNVFDFQVLATTKGAAINYEVIADKIESSTLPENMIKVYLTTLSGNIETEVATTVKNNVVTTYNELTDTSISGQTGKTLFEEMIPNGQANYNKQFRLRMWLSESASNQTDGEWDYNNKSFSIRINVIANGEKASVPPKPDYVDASGATKPELDAGMIPVYYDGNTLKKADLKSEWYDYDNKEWANAILVTEDTKATYQNAVGGTKINTSDVLAYFVWIPRYRYKLFNVEGAKGTTPQSIEIIFEDKGTQKSTGTTNGAYLTAPGFTFGDQELNGFWVGKFETTGDTTTPTVLPNEPSIIIQSVSSLFEISQKFKTTTYGLSLESKMMKNTEWGAVTYLSHSKYGINTEIRINNYLGTAMEDKHRTGCGASTPNASYIREVCQIVYGEQADLSYPQSTTGNITGIFDMSGGAYDYVMGVVADPSGKPRSGNTVTDNSGYTGMLTRGEIYNGKEFPEAKYYDLYTGTTFLNSCNGKPCLGQALVETVGWYQDNNMGEFGMYPSAWILRGGHSTINTSAGAYATNGTSGGGLSYMASRAVIIPSN